MSGRQLPQQRMTVEAFLAWEEDREGRHELYNGAPVRMLPETVSHSIVKASVAFALRSAAAKAGSCYRAWIDGVGVCVDDFTKLDPDACVTAGPFDLEKAVVDNPLIVVEVVSPSIQKIDATRKLTKYFLAPTIQHYLIVLIDERIVIHHRRDGDRIATTICPSGEIALDPPGIIVAVADFFADLPEPEAHAASG